MFRYFISPNKDETSFFTGVTIKENTISIYYQYSVSFFKLIINRIPFISESLNKAFISHHDLMIEKLTSSYIYCTKELQSQKEFIPNTDPSDHKELHSSEEEKQVPHQHYEIFGTVTSPELKKFFSILKQCESTQDLPPGAVFFNLETAVNIVEEYQKFRKKFYFHNEYSISNYPPYLDSSFPSLKNHTDCLPIVNDGNCSVPYINTIKSKPIAGILIFLLMVGAFQKIKSLLKKLAPGEQEIPIQRLDDTKHHVFLGKKPKELKENASGVVSRMKS